MDKTQNSFMRTLGELRKGNTTSELSDELANLVKEVERTGKSGEIVLKLKVRPSGDGESVSVQDSISVKIPKMDKKETTFFVGEDGGLLRSNPNQSEMFSTIDGGATNQDQQTAVNE